MYAKVATRNAGSQQSVFGRRSLMISAQSLTHQPTDRPACQERYLAERRRDRVA